MLSRLTTCCAAASLALLGACGGGGSSGGVASAPPPAPAPTPVPTPTPTPTAVLAPEAVALRSDGLFVTYGVTETDTLSSARDPQLSGSKQVEHITVSRPGSQNEATDFRYDRATGVYSITFPDGSGGDLVLKYLNGAAGRIASSTGHSVNGPSGEIGVLVTLPVPNGAYSPYSYSHFGDWTKVEVNADGSAIETYGLFVYGMETPATGVPRTGSAAYSGRIVANSPMDPWVVGGTVRLDFDFSAGTLAGYIHPVFQTNGWFEELNYDYGRFDFSQTVYATGSARYSGTLARDGATLTGSWFDGGLTGPNGEEAIGRFVAPFTRDGTQAALTGIWVAKSGQ